MKTRLWLAAISVACLTAQTPPKSINPAIREIVNAVSEERIAATLAKLESFGTRNIFSDQENSSQGIGAARRWIFEQFQSYSPRLQLSYDQYKVRKQPRVYRDVDIANVVAILPGTMNQGREIIVSGHYDSVQVVRKPRSADDPPEEEPERDSELEAAAPSAPGVTDDASGTATVMELARVMSQHEFEKTIIFIAFAGEEQGMLGSGLYAAKARRENRTIEAIFNNDIIGSEKAGDGHIENRIVRVFSEDPSDSTSRQLARYIKEMGERYVPSMKVDLIFRHDRFARGGDHTPFNAQGFAAVRFTAAAENYANQHSPTDSFANTSPGYTTRVARVNAAAMASLALAPKAPVVTRELMKGPRKGEIVANIGRGKSGYDAVLRWSSEGQEPDLAGYAIVMRSTTAPYWEKEIFVGKVSQFQMENVSIDEVVLGVKAIDKDGNESLVSAYIASSFPSKTVEVY